MIVFVNGVRTGDRSEPLDKCIRTQKARGIFMTNSVVSRFQTVHLLQSEEDVEKYCRSVVIAQRTFARPCPVTPRHGFAESRVVTTPDEVRQVWKETIAADPEGELLIMPYLESVASAIVTPQSIAVGPDNDGATAGKPGCKHYPLAYINMGWARAAVPLPDAPFVEIVVPRASLGAFDRVVMEARRTQVRAGPIIPIGTSIVPKTTKITEVIKAEGDQLEWETLMRAKVSELGVVVWQPGGNPLSHYSIHAFVNQIPIVFTSNPPKVGSMLEATKEAKPRWSSREFRRGVNAGMDVAITGYQKQRYHTIMDIILLVTHHTSAFLQKPEGSYYIGMAAALMFRLGTAACVGELRHAGTEWGGHARSYVYTEMLSSQSRFLDKLYFLGIARWAFENLAWNRGFGGLKWAVCAESMMSLFDMIQNNGSRVYARKRVCQLLNAILNLAHNNGWWLNKFVSSTDMDNMAAGAFDTTVKSAIGLWFVQKEIGDVAQESMIFQVQRPVVQPVLPDGSAILWRYSRRTKSRKKEVRVPLDVPENRAKGPSNDVVPKAKKATDSTFYITYSTAPTPGSVMTPELVAKLASNNSADIAMNGTSESAVQIAEEWKTMVDSSLPTANTYPMHVRPIKVLSTALVLHVQISKECNSHYNSCDITMTHAQYEMWKSLWLDPTMSPAMSYADGSTRRYRPIAPQALPPELYAKLNAFYPQSTLSDCGYTCGV